MASNMQMSRVCRNHGVPYVVSIHGMLDDWSMAQRGLKKRIFLALGARRHLAAADCLQYTAAGERDQAQKWVPGARPTILAPIIDLSPYQQLTSPELARKRFSISADVPLLAFVSRLHPKKGVEILIDAADLLRKRGVSFKVIIAGAAAEADRDYETKLREQVTRLNLTDLVQFAGLVTGTEKISLYQAADLFVLPTHQENFGLVLIEAMACGTPVLTTRGTDIWQEIAGGGATISENNPQAMHQAIVQLLDNPELEAIGRRGREWALDRFAIDTIALGFEKMYSDALTRAGRN
jgi:glycosyltransferase involved in cell wall biosynthesis